MPPRFTQVPPQQPPALGGRFTPVTRPTSGTGLTSQPDPLRAGLGVAKGVNSLFGLGSNIAGSPRFTAVSQGLGGGLGLAQGGMNLARGNTVQGALQVAGGAASLGGAARVIPSKIAGPVSAALGIGSGVYDLVRGGSGQELAMGLASLANPAFSTIYSGSQLAGMAMDALAGQGIFGQTPLPIAERGRGFSSAENAASQISKMRGIQAAKELQRFIEQPNSPNNLFSLAQMGSNPNWSSLPTGEIQFTHKNTPTPAAYGQLMQAVQSGDPNALRDFISGVSIQTGESGATKADYPLTDWYRRQFVSSLPGNHPLRQNMTGLFEPTPQSYLEPHQYLASINPSYFTIGGGLDRGFSPEDITGEWGGMYTTPALSPFGRTKQENASLAALHKQSTDIRNNPDFIEYVNRQYFGDHLSLEEGREKPWPSQLVAAGINALGGAHGTPESLMPRVPKDIFHSGFHAITGEPMYTSSSTGSQYTGSAMQADQALPMPSLAEQFADLNSLYSLGPPTAYSLGLGDAP